MKVLVLGKNGMLGHVVYNYFKDLGIETYGTVSHENGVDILFDANENMKSIEKTLEKLKPTVVINCIGILNSVAENNKALAVKLNSLLPHYMDNLSNEYNFKFVHVSTDCVFEGNVGKYDETSRPDATSFYGRSKALGEIKNNKNVTLRTSIVGPDNNENAIGLFKWFITQTGTVNGYTKVIWTGVTTIELAKAIKMAIDNNLCGLHHVVNNNFIAKKDLLELFKKFFEKDINIENDDTISCEKTLVRTKISYDFNVPTYENMICEMKDWVLNHKDLYPLIFENCELGVEKKR